MFERINRLKWFLFLVVLVTMLFFYSLGYFNYSVYSLSAYPIQPSIEGAVIIIILTLLIFLIDSKYPNFTRKIYEWEYRWDFRTSMEAFFLGIFLIIIMSITELKFSWLKYIYPHSIEISLVIFFLFVLIVVFAFAEWKRKQKIMTKRIHK